MVQKDKELAPALQDDGYSPLQRTIQAFIRTDITHRRAIEQWATDAGMHRSQHRMLMYLTRCEGSPSQKDIAKHFDISPAAVTVTLKKLESDGYIERGKCGECTDSRINEIKITEQGRRAAMQSRKYFQHVDGEAFKGFSPEELEEFTALLERMQENLKNIAPLPGEEAENSENYRKDTGK